MGYKRWTADELRILQQGKKDKLTYKEIGEILGRSEKAVQLKAFKQPKPKKMQRVVQHVPASVSPAAQPQLTERTLIIANIGLTIVLLALTVIN